jgi:hypothetical protein
VLETAGKVQVGGSAVVGAVPGSITSVDKFGILLDTVVTAVDEVITSEGETGGKAAVSKAHPVPNTSIIPNHTNFRSIIKTTHSKHTAPAKPAIDVKHHLSILSVIKAGACAIIT